MFKRSIAILVTALMCASALTGCGNTDEGQTSGNTASDNTVNAGNAKTSGNTGKTVLRIISMQSRSWNMEMVWNCSKAISSSDNGGTGSAGSTI